MWVAFSHSIKINENKDYSATFDNKGVGNSDRNGTRSLVFVRRIDCLASFVFGQSHFFGFGRTTVN